MNKNTFCHRKFMTRTWSGMFSLAGILWLALAGVTLADVKPGPLISDGMVLQQQAEVKIGGAAAPGEAVTVSFRDQSVSTVANDKGVWLLRVQSKGAGGPFPMTIKGSNTIQLSNVYVGEVWVLSGQSNFEFALGRVAGGLEASANSANPLLRLFVVPHTAMETPQTTVPGSWVESKPQTTKNFSAAGYWFGEKLQKKLGVPVGIILSVMGGTTIEAWLSHEVLAPYITEDPLADYNKLKAAYDARVVTDMPMKKKYDEEVAAAKAAGAPLPTTPRLSGPFRGPSLLYNGMIAPIGNYTIKGAAWYQGENNAQARSPKYEILLAKLIQLYRSNWGQGDFPFIVCQLAPFVFHQPVVEMDPNTPSGIAEVRDAQLHALSQPNTALVVTMDLGDSDGNVHYTHKEPVGDRMVLAAMALAYGSKEEYSGPLFQGAKFQGGKAIASFSHLGGGLVAKGGPLAGFTLAGADKKFYRATAVIVDATVVVSSPNVPAPVAVRYGWADYPVPPLNLWNKADLPASPFRSDDWPQDVPQRQTAPKK
jgi:sialate O-acetylesterase